MDQWLWKDNVFENETAEIEASTSSETASDAGGPLPDQNHGDDVETTHQDEGTAQDDELDDLYCLWCNNDICRCEPCEYCDNYPADCQCHWCGVCNRRTFACFCQYCRKCGGRGSLCVCDPCTACEQYLSVCRCVECRYCNQLVRTGYYEQPCKCAECSLCRSWLPKCRCAGEQTRREKVNLGSRLFEVVATVGPDQNLLLGGDVGERHVIVVQTGSALLQSLRGGISSRLYQYGVLHWYEKLKEAVERSAVYLEVERWINVLRFRWEPVVEDTHINVTTAEQVKKMVTVLATLPRDGNPHIAFDLEADNLGRHGTTCYIQIRDYIHEQTYLVDLHTLKDTAFVTTGENDSTTLRDILQDPSLIKLIFDCRQDSDALFWTFNPRIRLAGVLDVQIVRMLNDKDWRGFRPSLNKTIIESADLTVNEKLEWRASKNHGFWGSDKGYAVFMDRPLPAQLKAYAVNDVKYLRRIHDKLIKRLSRRGYELAVEWTQREIESTWEENWCSSKGFITDGFEMCWNEGIHVST